MLIFPDTEMQNANMYPKYVFFLIALEQMLPTFQKAFPTFFYTAIRIVLKAWFFEFKH